MSWRSQRARWSWWTEKRIRSGGLVLTLPAFLYCNCIFCLQFFSKDFQYSHVFLIGSAKHPQSLHSVTTVTKAESHDLTPADIPPPFFPPAAASSVEPLVWTSSSCSLFSCEPPLQIWPYLVSLCFCGPARTPKSPSTTPCFLYVQQTECYHSLRLKLSKRK